MLATAHQTLQQFLDMPPNVLRICLMRGRELPVMDKALTTGAAGSSDPYAIIKVASAHRDATDRHLEVEPFRSSTKEASLRPVWMERFDSLGRRRNTSSTRVHELPQARASTAPRTRCWTWLCTTRTTTGATI